MNAFHVLGALLAIWAVVLAGLGITRERFPGNRSAERLVGAISIVLVALAIGSGVITSATEEEEEPAEAAEAERAAPAAGQSEPEGGGGAAEAGALEIATDPRGDLSFGKEELAARAGRVTVELTNESPVQHDFVIERGGKDVAKTDRITSGTDTVTADLAAGRYTFYCSVDAHRQGGMEGTLTVK